MSEHDPTTGQFQKGSGGRRRGSLNRKTVSRRIREAIIDLAAEGDAVDQTVLIRRLRELRDDDPATFAELLIRIDTTRGPFEQHIQC